MISLSTAFLWCGLQITLLLAIAAIVYWIACRTHRESALAVVLVSLIAVAVLNAAMFLPGVWGWSLSSPIARDADDTVVSMSATDVDASNEYPLESSLPSPGYAWSEGTEEETLPAESPAGFSAIQPIPENFVETANPTRRNLWTTLALIGWAIVLFGSLRLIVALRCLRHYRKSSQSIHDPALLHTATAIGSKLGLQGMVTIRESDAVPSPATIDWLRPLVLLPPSWKEWTVDEQAAVLAHELAHVRLSHFPQWLWGQLVLTATYYHPLVHWLSSKLRLEQELAADALAARALGDRRKYTAALATLALRPGATGSNSYGPGLFMSQPLLLRRLEMLRKDAVRSTRKSKLPRYILVLLVVLAGLIVCGFRLRATAQTNEDLYPYPGAPKSEAGPADQDDVPAVLTLQLLDPKGKGLDIQKTISPKELELLLPLFLSKPEDREKFLAKLDAPLRDMLTDDSANEPHTYEVSALFRVAANRLTCLGRCLN